MRRFTLALIFAAGCTRGTGKITLASPAFGRSQPIPAKFTCTGENISPPLQWNGLPKNAAKLTLHVDDPDAPGGHFTHWDVTQIPASTNAIPEGGHVGIEGTNGFGQQGYGGPCPPSGEHHYVFTLRALDTNGKEMARGELIGTYAK